MSPIESYIAHQKRKIENQEAKIESLEDELAEYTARRTLSSTSSLPCCNKCHRKEGHNRLNCPYPTVCTSSLFCGNIDKHPDDKQMAKQKTKQLNEERKSLLAMKDELKNREKSSASVAKRYTARVKETLIKSNPEKYLRFVNGNQIEDWRLINKDSKILEKEFKDKIPTADEARETIEEIEDFLETKEPAAATGKTSVRNPYKKLWQDRGISWPHGETKCADDSSPMHSPQRKKSREEDDDFQLAKGMQKSLDSLPFHFNLDEYEQNITDGVTDGVTDGYLHDNESSAHNNYEVTQNMKKKQLGIAGTRCIAAWN